MYTTQLQHRLRSAPASQPSAALSRVILPAAHAPAECSALQGVRGRATPAQPGASAPGGGSSSSSSAREPLSASAAAAAHHSEGGATSAGMSSAHASEAEWYRHGVVSLSQGVTMADTLQRLGDKLDLVPLERSAFVKPQSIMFEMDGKARRWDMVESHPSVAALLFHRQRQAVILVRQFRPAVYVSAVKTAEAAGEPRPPLAAGFTYELCAGIVDKPGLDLVQITKEEILEECGYDVPRDQIRLVTSYLSAIGISGSRQTIFAAEVEESMAVTEGGGGLRDHGEAIEVLALPVASIEAFVMDASIGKSAGLLFSLMWLLDRLEAHGGQLFPPPQPAAGAAAAST